MDIVDIVEPFAALHRWMEAAATTEPDVPDAMQLTTVGPGGRPSIRTVLLKQIDHGLVFYTNSRSRKGRELEANAHAAICLHWKSLARQVMAEGLVHPIDDAAADAYFASRPRGSQIGAWASEQSTTIRSRAELEQRMDALAAQYADRDIPRPPHWGGYRLVPHRFEFWQGRLDRLHDRVELVATDEGWDRRILQP